MDDLGQTFFQVYTYGPVADKKPPAGQIVIVTKAPGFGNAHIVLVTDGVNNIQRLFEDWQAGQVGPQAVMPAIIAEQQARIAADNAEQQARIAADNDLHQQIMALYQEFDALQTRMDEYVYLVETLRQFVESKHGPLCSTIPLIVESGEYLVTENDNYLVVA